MKLLLRVWRQRRADQPGAFEEYPVPDAAPDMTVLELLDRLNETLAERGVDPIAFDSDCREGICGACGITIDGVPHGPVANVATCNQHVRSFADGATVTLEPFRAGSFPVVRDLVVDRAALDRLLAAGSYVSVDAGTAGRGRPRPRTRRPSGRSTLLRASAAGRAWSPAQVGRPISSPEPSWPISPSPGAARPNAVDALGFTVDLLDAEFGPCSTHGECAEVCPASIPLTAIATVNREHLRAPWRRRDD